MEKGSRERPGLGLAAVAATVLLWSASNVVVKALSTTGLITSFYRLWFAAAVLWTAVALVPGLRRRLTRDWLRASIAGGILFGMHQILFFVAIKATSVANVLIIGACQPALVLLVAGRMFGERSSLRDAICAIIAFAGMVTLVVGSVGTPHWNLFGDVLALINLFVFTAYFLVSKRIRAGSVGPSEYIIGITTVAGLIVGVAVLINGEDLASPSGIEWFALFLIGVLPGTMGHFLTNWAHAHTSIFVVSIMLLAVPVLASAGAALFLGELLAVMQIAGGVMVLSSIAVIVRSTS